MPLHAFFDLRMPSCCSEIVARRSIPTSQDVLAATGIQTRSRSREQSSRYFGVRFRPDLSKWVAEIRVAEWKAVDKKVWLGTFESEVGAARAVDAARKLLNCRKKRPPNFPCDKLTKYSERIPSYLLLTDLTNDTMFKRVTQFVKKKSQEYAATFNSEDFQALLSDLPDLKIAPEDPLDQTSYSQESIEDVLADQVDSQEDIKPCAMRTVSDESEYETTHSRRHSHSHSDSSVPQSWLPEDAGEGNCSLGIHQDMPIAKRLKQEPTVMDESTEFHLCDSIFGQLHLLGIDYQSSDAEGVDSGEKEYSMIDSYPYDFGTTWEADQPMAMNTEVSWTFFSPWWSPNLLHNNLKRTTILSPKCSLLYDFAHMQQSWGSELLKPANPNNK